LGHSARGHRTTYGKRWLTILEEAVATGAATAQAAGSLAFRQVLLAHPGTQYSGRLARQLQTRGALREFHTCFAFSDHSLLARAVERLPRKWRLRLANRVLTGVAPERLHTRPWLELAALASRRLGDAEQEVFYRRNAAFQERIPDRAIREAGAVIGFDTSSWILARRARELKRAFFLDQSIGHPRSFARVATQLTAEFPQWTETIPWKSEAEIAREDQEHADASCIVAPSRFVVRTLRENGVDPAKIRLNPFGVDLALFRPAMVPPELKPLRFLFAGSARPRKGLPLLLKAWRRLPRGHAAQLWIAGGGDLPASERSGSLDGVRFLGRLPQRELAAIFAQCHIFVFPSYFEGLAQVQIEAAACGLPVIGTESSGCEEIVQDGETGLVLPTGDLEALHNALRTFISDPERALAMRERLLKTRSGLSWEAYGERWMNILGDTAWSGIKNRTG